MNRKEARGWKSEKSIESTRLRDGTRRENRGQTSGTRQSPFSREGDIGFLTSILLTLTSDPPRERSELSLTTLHAPLSTILKRTLDNTLSPLLPTTCNEQRTTDLKSTLPVGRGMPPPRSSGDLRSRAEERKDLDLHSSVLYPSLLFHQLRENSMKTKFISLGTKSIDPG